MVLRDLVLARRAISAAIEEGLQGLYELGIGKALWRVEQSIPKDSQGVGAETRQLLLEIGEGVLPDLAIVLHELFESRVGLENRNPALAKPRDCADLYRFQALRKQLGEAVMGLTEFPQGRGGDAPRRGQQRHVVLPELSAEFRLYRQRCPSPAYIDLQYFHDCARSPTLASPPYHGWRGASMEEGGEKFRRWGSYAMRLGVGACATGCWGLGGGARARGLALGAWRLARGERKYIVTLAHANFWR